MSLKLNTYWKWLPCIMQVILLLAGCGGEAATEDLTPSEDEIANTVNTDKLVGTPFEGMETGDDLEWDLFRCGKHRTETIDSFPIKIFTAYFTRAQEAVIQEGIDIANEAMGEEVYVLTDEWSDDLRVMYKVDKIEGDEEGFGVAITIPRFYRFNDKRHAEKISSDWAIELSPSTTDSLNFKWIVAHELGHASGILSHMRIDYVNDTLVELELHSVMQANGAADLEHTLDDYNFMMQMQAQIMKAHFKEIGDLEIEQCNSD